jgi:hypothetical protein
MVGGHRSHPESLSLQVVHNLLPVAVGQTGWWLAGPEMPLLRPGGLSRGCGQAKQQGYDQNYEPLGHSLSNQEKNGYWFTEQAILTD